jgi:hypothetical protein
MAVLMCYGDAMNRPHFSPKNWQPAAAPQRSARTAKGIRELLQNNNGIAALLPAAERLAALQKDCAMALPAMFDACSLIQFTSGQLTLSVPNAALAAKLKQQLPRLQDSLATRGWQVNAIRLKVQVMHRAYQPAPALRQLTMPASAIQAFSELKGKLADAQDETPLQQALQRMIDRHRKR